MSTSQSVKSEAKKASLPWNVARRRAPVRTPECAFAAGERISTGLAFPAFIAKKCVLNQTYFFVAMGLELVQEADQIPTKE